MYIMQTLYYSKLNRSRFEKNPRHIIIHAIHPISDQCFAKPIFEYEVSKTL